MRFYALLATPATGVAPFRVATYYLDESAWEHEDIGFDQLEAAARTVASKVARAGELGGDPPPPTDELRLVASAACRWCTRAAVCPASAAAGHDHGVERDVLPTVPRLGSGELGEP